MPPAAPERPTPRALVEALMLAVVLPGIGGAVNAAGFLALGVFTSHVTGTVARLGDWIADGSFREAWLAAGTVVTFFSGAASSTVLVGLSKQRARARYVAPLLVQALVLCSYLFLTLRHTGDGTLHTSYPQVLILAFAMGLQNALVTKISGAVVRTTHLTGIVTDAGIETVNLLSALPDLWRGSRAWEPFLRDVGSHQALTRLRLHAAIFASFLMGATLGAFVYLHVGPWFVAGPVLALILLALMDAQLGLTRKHGEFRLPS